MSVDPRRGHSKKQSWYSIYIYICVYIYVYIFIFVCINELKKGGKRTEEIAEDPKLNELEHLQNNHHKIMDHNNKMKTIQTHQ